MRIFSFSGVVAFFTAVTLAIMAVPAHAQLLFSLTQSTIITTAGSLITYQGTITNQSLTQGYFINNFSFAINNGGTQSIQEVDTASFFGYFAAPGAFPSRQLPANSSYTGNIVDVTVRNDAISPDTDAGQFLLQGGVSASDAQALGFTDFTLIIQPVPEGNSAALLTVGMVAGGAVYLRRRGKR